MGRKAYFLISREAIDSFCQSLYKHLSVTLTLPRSTDNLIDELIA